MSYMPLVSVVVPVYNAEETIERCVDSIVRQSFIDWELILVDDGSVDASGIICDSFTTHDSRIECVHCENGGVSVARNMGISQAHGAYVMFVDSDDWIESKALEVLYEEARIHDADMVIPRMRQMHYAADGAFEKQVLHDDDYNLLVYDTELAKHFERLFSSWALFSSQGTLYRHNFIVEHGIAFDPRLSVLEDFCFNLDCLQAINRLYHKNYISYNFYVRNFDEYKFKRGHEKTIDGITGLYARFSSLLHNKEIAYLPSYATFFLYYWIQVIQIVSEEKSCFFDKYRMLHKVGRTCKSQQVLKYVNRHAVEAQYYALFKTGSPIAFYLVQACKGIRDVLELKP